MAQRVIPNLLVDKVDRCTLELSIPVELSSLSTA